MEKIPEHIKKNMACDRIGRKLVKYLEENKANGIIDFHLRIDSDTHFYIHARDTSSETLDISWDWTKATHGNEVFGYINKGNDFDDPAVPIVKETEDELFDELLNDYDRWMETPDNDFESYVQKLKSKFTIKRK